MSTVTTNQGITIPVGTDAADNPQAFVDMIAGVEGRLVQRYTSNADRAARNPTPATGEMSLVAGNTWYDRYTGAKWLPCTPISSVKAADQSVNNSTTMTNVIGLVVPLPLASTSYSIEAWVPYTSSTVADLKLGFVAPAGADCRFGGPGLAFNAASNIGDGEFGFTGTGGTIVFGGSGGFVALGLRGVVIVGATTGTLQLQFAQGALEVSNTTITLGSWLKVEAIS